MSALSRITTHDQHRKKTKCLLIQYKFGLIFKFLTATAWDGQLAGAQTFFSAGSVQKMAINSVI